MSESTVDLAVLGVGKAGETLAATVGRMGKRVALIERSAAIYGGTCVNVACIPTTVLDAAEDV